MRLFYAVALPEALRHSLTQTQEVWRQRVGERGARWTDPENFHVTLKFLGDVPETRLPVLREAGQQAAAQVGPFTLSVGAVGVFPDARRPQVLWAGLGAGVPHLARLAECLDSGLEPQGIAREKRAFHPHITLARVKTRDGEKAVAQAMQADKTPADHTDSALENAPEKQAETAQNSRQTCSEVIQYCCLVASELRPQGSVYTVVDTFTLAHS